MASVGTVREFHADEGWGVLDGVDVPGGCWVSFAAVQKQGYRSLTAGQAVRFIAERANQDGYGYRAVKVWPGSDPDDAASLVEAPKSDGYESALETTAEPMPPEHGG
jgi:CspA family cold shock protein